MITTGGGSRNGELLRVDSLNGRFAPPAQDAKAYAYLGVSVGAQGGVLSEAVTPAGKSVAGATLRQNDVVSCGMCVALFVQRVVRVWNGERAHRRVHQSKRSLWEPIANGLRSMRKDTPNFASLRNTCVERIQNTPDVFKEVTLD